MPVQHTDFVAVCWPCHPALTPKPTHGGPMSDLRWIPAEQHVPHLLADVMHMGTVHYNGHEIEQYKHCDTRRYLNLDHSGQAWQITAQSAGNAVIGERIDFAAALAEMGGDHQ